MAEDVNDRVRGEWKDDSTPFERVLTVLKRTYEAQSADEIASRALTTPTTARKHLQQLSDSGFAEITAEPDRNATLYRRSNESLILERASDIIDEMDTDTVVDRIGEMQADINRYREQFGVESPEDAAIRGADVNQEALRDWQTTRRNLAITRAALALINAEQEYRAAAGV